MKTTLELAARALCELDGHSENATMEGKPLWKNYLREARAVLIAIRDPSPEMLKVDPPFPSQGFIIEDGWRLMIDAALAEQP